MKLRGIQYHGLDVINHDTKEYVSNDGRSLEDCVCCHQDKSDQLNVRLNELNDAYYNEFGSGYPHAESEVMGTLCSKHLYEYIY
jgi:hypothetical protein